MRVESHCIQKRNFRRRFTVFTESSHRLVTDTKIRFFKKKKSAVHHKSLLYNTSLVYNR